MGKRSFDCLGFALDFDEQMRSGFRYQYSSYQIEYSRNQVFQALIDHSRVPLDLQSIGTILGYRRAPNIASDQAIGRMGSERRETCL